MSDRCILAVRFTPAGTGGQVRRAVGGFLRYVQHRDLHPVEKASPEKRVTGMLKYVAYRDRAGARTELFGPAGSLGSADRKAFAAYVSRSIDESAAQPFRARDGQVLDRRRAVYRMVISPERAEGLDLRRLTSAAVASLEGELAVEGLPWMAAIHRNTAHPHIHLVLAGMREQGGRLARVDITKPRLAAMKLALNNEIQRQRHERSLPDTDTRLPHVSTMRRPLSSNDQAISTSERPPRRPLASGRRKLLAMRVRPRPAVAAGVIRLAAVARRYRCEMERAAEDEARRHGWELAG